MHMQARHHVSAHTCLQVKYVEDNSGLLAGVAGVLAAVADEVALIGAEVHQAHLQHRGGHCLVLCR